MAGLVDYPSSSEEEGPITPPTKKRKLSPPAKGNDDLPPLPAAFLDQYSSTVRTSAQDDPSLHGGRKRVTPHVAGSWPAHVYLEWHPNVQEAKVLTDVVTAVQDHLKDSTAKNTDTRGHDRGSKDKTVHGLLEDDLGVAQPLHISLSRPLTLKTEQKDDFLARLQQSINEYNVNAFDILPKDLAWHSNENGTRWFLVLRLHRSKEQEMLHLLEGCNQVANEYEQPLLYASKDVKARISADENVGEKFHVSVAWSLEAPGGMTANGRRSSVSQGQDAGVPYELLAQLTGLSIGFSEIKVRIGQDVLAMPLKAARRRA